MSGKNYIKYLLSLLLSGLTVISTGQATQINQILETDTLTADEKGSKHSLFAGTGLGSNMIYLGSTISGDKPFGYANLSYGFNEKLFVSVSTMHLKELDPYFQINSGSLSFRHVFNSWFDFSTSVSGFRISEKLRDSIMPDFIYADLSVGLDWRILYTTITGGALVSYEAGPAFQVKNSRYFQTPDIPGGKFNISFDPYFNLLWGNYTSVTTTSVITGTTTTTSAGRWGYGQKQTTTYQTTDQTTVNKDFRFLGIDLGLPVSLNARRFTFEAEAVYMIPGYHDDLYPAPKGFIFNAGVIFKLF